jgi:hypothetical protein
VLNDMQQSTERMHGQSHLSSSNNTAWKQSYRQFEVGLVVDSSTRTYLLCKGSTHKVLDLGRAKP